MLGVATKDRYRWWAEHRSQQDTRVAPLMSFSTVRRPALRGRRVHRRHTHKHMAADACMPPRAVHAHAISARPSHRAAHATSGAPPRAILGSSAPRAAARASRSRRAAQCAPSSASPLSCMRSPMRSRTNGPLVAARSGGIRAVRRGRVAIVRSDAVSAPSARTTEAAGPHAPAKNS